MSKEGKLLTLRLDGITLDTRLQCRAGIDMETVEGYAEAVKSGVEDRDGTQPRVYSDTLANVYWLADGWHWWHARRKAGKKDMKCFVVPGNFHDALRYAVGANATHGKPRTREDKHRAILACLENEDLAKLSTREIADLCHVSRDLAERIRGVHETAKGGTKKETRVGKDGKEQTAIRMGLSKEPEPQPLPTPVEPDDIPPEFGEPVGGAEPMPQGETDAKGRPIPAELLPVFAGGAWFGSRVQGLGRLLTDVNDLRAEPEGAFLSPQSVQIAVQNLQSAISSSRPYIVCPCCAGTKREGGLDGSPDCKLCRAEGKPQGWLPAGKWNALTENMKHVAESFKKGDAWEGD